jgi:C-terminal processing protease CtpA/Prc
MAATRGDICNVGLGIVYSVKGHEVRNLVKYGPAELSKQILERDILLNINERSTVQMSQDAVNEVCYCSSQRTSCYI